jgi:hypothetical protein
MLSVLVSFKLRFEGPGAFDALTPDLDPNLGCICSLDMGTF